MKSRLSHRSLVVLFLLVFLILLPLAASAFDPSSVSNDVGDSWDTGLAKIYTILSSSTVKIIGFLMILAAGIMIAVSEGQALKRVMWIICGIGVAMNVPGLFGMLFPSAQGFEIPVSHLQNTLRVAILSLL
jgi:type IV secretory pathway VirB2 component (pilin)